MILPLRSLCLLAVLGCSLASLAQTTEFGGVQVLQNDVNNNVTSVTLSKAPGSSLGVEVVDGNRGDYNVNFTSGVDPALGVLIPCISELSRDNTAGGDTIGRFYATAAFGPNDGLADYSIAVFSAPAGDEVNINLSFGFFPYSKWLGGIARNTANNGALTEFVASPSLVLGTHFVDSTATAGIYTLNLNPVTGNNAAQNGVLLVAGARNEDNFVLSQSKADGTFEIYCHDNGENSTTYENDAVAFVYLPTSKLGTDGLVALGRVNGDASQDVSSSLPEHAVTVSKPAITGTWYLSIAGVSPATGTLIVSAEGGVGNNIDNIVSHAWDPANNRWIIESRDLPGATPGLQNAGAAGDDVFSYAFFAAAVVPTVTLDSPAAGATAQAGATVELAATAADADGGVVKVEFLRNGVVIAVDEAAPFAFSDAALPAGHYDYQARATDNEGHATTTAAAQVVVSLNPDALPANAALSLDGADDYVSMGPAPGLNVGALGDAGFTLECWFRKEGNGLTTGSGSGGVTAVPLFGKGRGESDGSNVDCNIFFGINAAGLLVADFEAYPATGISAGANFPFTAGNTPITDGAWHHAAVTYDHATSTWKMYLDGALVGTKTNTDGARPRYDSIQHFGIGTSMTSSGAREGAFRGRIDEARVWSYARSASEIAAGKEHEIGTAAGLLGRFGFNESTGAVTVSSDGLHTGNLGNGPVWVDGAPFGTVNALPTVALTQPVNDASVVMPGPVTFEAAASDSDGAVARVEFFVDGVKVGEDSIEPYAHSWAPSAPGNYVVTARASDGLGTTLSSPAVLHILANPNQPNVGLGGPADGAVVTGGTANLEANVSDPNGDPMTVTFYGRLTTPSAPGDDFSIIQIPDTQFYSEGNPSRATTVTVEQLIGTFGEQTQWVVDNRLNRNIAFVSHMGDIVQTGNNSGNNIEWTRADAAMARLENPATTLRAHGVPYGLAPGNHDIDPIGNYDGGSTAFYNQFFGIQRFAGRTYWGGNYGSDNTNNYQLFSISGLDFIAIHFAYDTTPNQAILDWADALLKAHPHRRAIVTSHSIIGGGNPANFSAQGQGIYNALKDNPNYFLMLCGHIHAEGRRTDVFDGRTVYSILSDYQGAINGGNGFLRILKFSPASNTIRLESYSPTLGRAVNASDGIPSWETSVTLPYDMQTPVMDWIPLGTANVQAGGTSAALPWTGLEPGKHYEWYAVASDGVNVTSSAPRRFTTPAGTAPTITLDGPAAGSTFTTPTAMTLTATAADADGTVSRVEFYRDGVKLGEDASAPYSYEWTGVPAGNYVLSAVAVDDANQATLSNTATVVVNPGDYPPAVVLTAPADGTAVPAPGSLVLQAIAQDEEGAVTKVEFFSGTTVITSLGEDSSAPFSLNLTGLPAGSYTFTARATDSVGQTTTSEPVTVSVFVEAAPPNAASYSAGAFDVPNWSIAHTTIHPRHFNEPGTVAGKLELKVDGVSVPFASGISLATNWNSPATIAGGIGSNDNLCSPYADASGNVFINVLDNSNNNAAGANPSTSSQTSGITVAFLPYAAQWTGASVASNAAVLQGNLPTGVSVSKAFAPGAYAINGLSTAGNLYAFPNGDSGTAADNVISVRVEAGRWVVGLRDNAGNGQDGPFSFVYVPPGTTGVFAAAISSTGVVSQPNADLAGITVTAAPNANGLDVLFGDGSVINPSTAAFFVTLDSTIGAQNSVSANNLVSWSAAGNSFRVFSQDLPGINGVHEPVDVRVLAIPYATLNLPNVLTIATSDAAAGEHGADQALNFVITRSGGTADPLFVSLSTSGSATAGADYSGFAESIVIPATQSSVQLPITVLPDVIAEGSESVQVSIETGAGYSVGAPASAIATIADRPVQDWYVSQIPDPALRGPGDDADGDGLSNVMEYLMGTQPGDANSRAVTTVTIGPDSATFWYQRALGRNDINTFVEWSTDLTNWYVGGEDNGVVSINIQQSTASLPAEDPQIIQGTATNAAGGALPERLFFRLNVVE